MEVERQSTYDVATFGIPDSELEILRRIFVVSAERPVTYRLLLAGANARNARIMLLDRRDRAEVARWADSHNDLPERPQTIYLTQNEPGDETLCLRRPLIATRVFAVLDRAVKALHRLDPTTDTGNINAFESSDTKIQPRQYRALVVDDSLTVRKQIAGALKKVRVDASFAESGEQALAALEQSHFDIVFLDVLMPGIDGYDACKRIKLDPEKKHIPVVLLTASSSPLDRVKGKISGCDTYLAKPVSKDDFYQTLRKHLTESTADSQDV